ncbi:MAG TPA: inositol monophosphatase family protein [Gammaproteobacteria bacterium]|nr:inositol monophosphatase family protein [Gammaproteobacteria bacterium]
MHPMLNIAVRAARRGGDLIVRHAARASDLRADAKGMNDYVTEVDRMAEEAIIDTLQTAYPTHGILAEESGRSGPEGDFLWIIDPLDGTTNFMHGFPQFAVSVALQVKGRIEQGVIYDPMRQELFTASRGAGARLNDRRIRVSKQRTLQGALLGTGFPFREQEHIDAYLQTLRAFMEVTAGIRRAGAAALDLAYVACGRLDGFWEFGLKPWDIAAGALLIEEAGGMVSSLLGEDDYLHQGHIMTGNTRIFREMQEMLKPYLQTVISSTRQEDIKTRKNSS